MPDDLTLQIREPIHGLAHQLEGELRGNLFLEVAQVGRNQVAERGGGVGRRRLVEAGHHPGRLGQVGPRLGTGVGGVVQLFIGGWALQLMGQLPQGGIHLLVAFGHLHGKPDGPPVLLDSPLQRLADPPGGIRREAEAPLPVELVDGSHQPEGALLDQVGKIHAPVLVAAGPVDHQPQVGGHHLPAGLLVTVGHPLGQLGLGVVVRKRVVVEVAEEEPEAVSFRAPGAIGGHRTGRTGSRSALGRDLGGLLGTPGRDRTLVLPGDRTRRHPSPHSCHRVDALSNAEGALDIPCTELGPQLLSDQPESTWTVCTHFLRSDRLSGWAILGNAAS